jgi:hypothetical protein
MRCVRVFGCALATIVLAACNAGQPAPATPQPSTALYIVNNGPYPVYATYDEWLSVRPSGISAAQAEHQTIDAARTVRAEGRFDPHEQGWLLPGCLFDVERTVADEQDFTYLWGYGRVVRCEEPIQDGVLEPQMGVRPNKLWVYDGHTGYVPMTLLDRYRDGQP